MFFRASIYVRCARLGKWEGAIYVRTNPTFFNAGHQDGDPFHDFLRLMPQVPQVQTEHAAVFVQQA
jgi:hypothetical protein